MPVAYDDIVVGAGSSGAALAARLSEDPDRSVLLLEAGPDFPTAGTTPAALLDVMQVGIADYDWGFRAFARPGREIDYPRGRVAGGSSAVNGAIALRGAPADYDEWAALGNEEWRWQRVLPYFRRLEDDRDFHDDLHGSAGPVPIARPHPEHWVPPQRAFADVCRDLGFSTVEDHNHPDASGIGPMPRNLDRGARVSTATAYLLPARHRLNLTVRGNCHVARVLLDGGRAAAVEVASGGEVQRVAGQRITLCAGALASPAILLRSGIGPNTDLAALGIEPLMDLAGVGANLIEHPQVGLNLAARPNALAPDYPMMQMLLTFTAIGSAERNDLQLYLMHFPESNTIRLSAVLQRPRSRGHLTLADADPLTPPRIDLNLCEDPEDLRRLAEGMRLALTVAAHPRIAAFHEGIATLDDGAVLSLDQVATRFRDDDALCHYVLAASSQFYHPVGTARMGPPDDERAVVDQYCRVRGVAGLRVVDASVMPAIPRANTNLTCIMIGERVADWMKSGR